ncbi:mycofactocin-coupled SDR family oxidoreductase [Pseudonocardia sp. CA-142604]|uniref:mycofactocin-coupled SDR family oxidoreductase n=1 Tax=Pseudonocardia sp. CA-142604 TaxID=3240024 RepID=UPI003D90C36D
MAGRVEGKVALVTGAARGQGRAHALRLADEGADVIAVDLCASIRSVPYALADASDLEETVNGVKALGRRAFGRRVDVRDFGALQGMLDETVADLGRLDIVVANAGILSAGPSDTLAAETWQDMIDVNLTGAYLTAKAGLAHIRAGGNGGSIILTSSALGIRALPNLAHYVAAKAGVSGLMRALALELAPDRIRVNTVNPSIVDTPMVHNAASYKHFLAHLDAPTRQSAAASFACMNPMYTPWIDAEDVSNAVLFLASDESRYVTGLELKIDAGFCIA